ncbi:MAG: hypothetical protein AABN33_18270 [Acidobacteriota bacterium]
MVTAVETTRSAVPIHQVGASRKLCRECGQNPACGDRNPFCGDCWSRRLASRTLQKPPKYKPNETIDRIIREHYLKRLENGGKPRRLLTLKQLGKNIGWSKAAVVNRARTLGLIRTRDDGYRWCEAEMMLLERYAYLTPKRIHLRFVKAGFRRSATAISMQLKRKHLRSTHEFYSAHCLAELFGVDRHLVARWINLGYLKSKRRGTDRDPNCGGDEWLMKDDWVRDFVLAHPVAFDIRKVDQVWFLNMLMRGKLCRRDEKRAS